MEFASQPLTISAALAVVKVQAVLRKQARGSSEPSKADEHHGDFSLVQRHEGESDVNSGGAVQQHGSTQAPPNRYGERKPSSAAATEINPSA